MIRVQFNPISNLRLTNKMRKKKNKFSRQKPKVDLHSFEYI